MVGAPDLEVNVSRTVRIWIIGGLIIGALAGAIIGYVFGQGADNPIILLVSWTIILAIGGTLFFGLWGYANDQHRKVRRPDLFKE